MTAYASVNFKTKKALKEAVEKGNKIRVRMLAPAGDHIIQNGDESICGPWFPEPHKWYARVKIKDSVIVSVT